MSRDQQQQRQRPRALATIAALAAATVATAAVSTPQPRITIELAPITAGPDPANISGPSLNRPTPAAPDTDRPLTTLAVNVQPDHSLDQPLLAAINTLRRSHHLQPLSRSRQLSNAATAHAEALAYAGLFEHSWPDGCRFDLWIRHYYPITTSHTWSVGENLLWSTGQAGSLTCSPAELTG